MLLTALLLHSTGGRDIPAHKLVERDRAARIAIELSDKRLPGAVIEVHAEGLHQRGDLVQTELAAAVRVGAAKRRGQRRSLMLEFLFAVVINIGSR